MKNFNMFNTNFIIFDVRLIAIIEYYSPTLQCEEYL